jgi:hypothetical protein
MAVTFSGKWALNPDTFGVNFEAHQNDARIMCLISQEALQDIQPSNATGTPQQQFQSNQMAFESIARRLIEAGESKDGVLHISSRHVLA